MRLICTDVYVSVDGLPLASEFVLYEKEKGLSLVLREVHRDTGVVYHGTPFFFLHEDDLQLRFTLNKDSSREVSFYLSRQSDEGWRHVSDYHYPQFAPKDGATTQSILGTLLLEQKPSLFSRLASYFVAPTITGIEAAIELHFYERVSEV